MEANQKPSRLIRLMSLYNQCLEDKQFCKAKQAEYLIEQIKNKFNKSKTN